MNRNTIHFIIACLILAVAIGFSKAQDTQNAIPLSESLENIPLESAMYVGSDVRSISILSQYDTADEQLLRSYTARNKDLSILLFVGYWGYQTEHRSIKSPRYMEGAQYFVGKKSVRSPQGSFWTMNSFVHDHDQQKQLIYYAFISAGQIIPDDYHFRLHRMIRTLIYRRNNAALIRASTPITPDVPLQEAEAYIEDFLGEFLPIVLEHLPK